jgi:peptidyl-prolyl cis-trans isomerase B (cyclophilin B)
MSLFGDPLHTPDYVPTGDEVAIFKTNKGEIRVKLDGEGAPIHVGNFTELANSGFYDDLKFHRYVPGFVIQGGCPNTRDMSPTDVAAGKSGPDGMPGTGGPGYRIKHEYDTNPRNSHVDGALAMARSSMPDSAGSQFYFCLGPQHNLDSGYTVFGTTESGMDVISQLRQGDVIESIRVEHADEA